jgi:capsid protein
MATRASDRPGLLAMARSMLAAPFEERLLRQAAARNERLQYEASSHVLAEIVQRVTPENDGFVPLGAVGTRELDAGTATELRDAARKAALENTHAVGYLSTLERFVVGEGPTITVEHDSAEVAKAADAWLTEFRRWNRWDLLEDELPMRTWRDGESFVRRFDAPPERLAAQKVTERLARLGFVVDEEESERPPEGMIFLRFMEPEHVSDPHGDITHGIVTAAADVETVLGYCWSPDGKAIKEVVPAPDVLHTKTRVDNNVKRGRSVLEPLLKRIKQYEDWLSYRITLNLMRTAVVLVKTINGSPGQIAGIRDQQQKQREDSPGSSKQLQMLKPGTTVHASPGVSYEFKNPQIQATDAKEDGRAILLTLAAATGMAEYMFTGDASNSNYSSTMVSESPSVREFQSWQDFYTPAYVQLHRWALVAGARAGAIKGLSEEDAKRVAINVAWPPLIARDELEHAQANKVRRDAGALSLEGLARDEGIDWTVEKARLEAEAEDPPRQPVATLLASIAQAALAGVLTPDSALETFVRDGMGIPALVEEQPLDEPPDPNDPNQPPMPPGRGGPPAPAGGAR